MEIKIEVAQRPKDLTNEAGDNLYIKVDDKSVTNTNRIENRVQPVIPFYFPFHFNFHPKNTSHLSVKEKVTPNDDHFGWNK
jgi:hypothetical protein